MALLVVTSGPAEGLRVEVRDGLTIGREHTDLELDDPEVSRRHALLRLTAGGLEIEDLGSRNGVRVDGLRIDAPTVLRDGAVVRLGKTTLRIELPAATLVGDVRGQATRLSPAVDGTVVGAATPAGTAGGTARTPAKETRKAAPLGPAPAREPAGAPAPPVPRPGPAAGGLAPASPDRWRVRGVATRLWLPTALTYAAIVGTAVALIAYFA